MTSRLRSRLQLAVAFCFGAALGPVLVWIFARVAAADGSLGTYEFIILLIDRWNIGPVGGLGWMCVAALAWERHKERKEISRHVSADVIATHELSTAVAAVAASLVEVRQILETMRGEMIRLGAGMQT